MANPLVNPIPFDAPCLLEWLPFYDRRDAELGKTGASLG